MSGLAQPSTNDSPVCARRRGCLNGEAYPTCIVCPFSAACPKCAAEFGAPCKRPSGHACATHSDRLDAADRKAITEHRDKVVALLGPEETTMWEARLNAA